MYVWRNNAFCVRVVVVWHISVTYINILRDAQQRFCAKCIPGATMLTVRNWFGKKLQLICTLFTRYIWRPYWNAIWWGKFSQKHNYKCMGKWWCLLAMEKLHVSAYNGHLQVLTTFLLKEFYIMCLNRVVMLRSHHHFTCFCLAKFHGMSVAPMNFYVAGCRSFRLGRCRVRRKLWSFSHIFIAVFLTEFTSPYSLNTQRGWHT